MGYKKLTASIFVVSSIVLTLSWSMGQASASVPGVNEIAAQTSTGAIGNGNTLAGTLSHDGRYVAFTSVASNLVTGDTNNAPDVFVRDRLANTVTRVSVASDGAQGNGESGVAGHGASPSISDDGRYVVFTSNASNLVSGDTNGTQDIFVHDMQMGTTQLVSSSNTGIIGNDYSDTAKISGDAKFVVFQSRSTNLVSPATTAFRNNVYVKNLNTGDIQLLSKSADGSEGNSSSGNPSISCDGGIVTFESQATNLVASDTNGKGDVFVVSRAGGDSITDITPTANSDSDESRVSCDGMQVAYQSDASNIVDNDTNTDMDIFQYDRRTGITTRVSVGSGGTQANDQSNSPAVSGDGRLIAFTSSANNLVTGTVNSTAQVFMRDTVTNTTYAISVNSSGVWADNGGTMSDSGFSNDGKLVYFESNATNLVSNDTNNANDGFIAQTGL